jgi:glutaconate CoA-transferase subunit A
MNKGWTDGHGSTSVKTRAIYSHLCPIQMPEETVKLTTMHDAIATYVHDGDTVAIEGFTACIGFAAAHEIIRQGRRDLVLCRMTPDLIYDQMVAAGCARKLVFSYLGNPGVGPLHAVRRAVEKGIPAPLELEEYSHFGMVARYIAGAYRLPFFPLRSYVGSDLPKVNPRIRFVESPYGDGPIAVVPPLNPDVAIIHAQRADVNGNTQLWGLLGAQKEAAFAARHVIVVVEEIVDEEVIRSDPNRTLIPGLVVDAVVHEPYGAHPSYVQGYYDRDNDFYLRWDEISRDEAATRAWLEEWVYGVRDRAEYVEKIGRETWERLKPAQAWARPVNYG